MAQLGGGDEAVAVLVEHLERLEDLASESVSFILRAIIVRNSKSIVPLPSASTSLIMSASSASVGFWPSERITVPSSFVVIVPSPSLSNREKASLNSAICSSVSWSACARSGVRTKAGSRARAGCESRAEAAFVALARRAAAPGGSAWQRGRADRARGFLAPLFWRVPRGAGAALGCPLRGSTPAVGAGGREGWDAPFLLVVLVGQLSFMVSMRRPSAGRFIDVAVAEDGRADLGVPADPSVRRKV